MVIIINTIIIFVVGGVVFIFVFIFIFIVVVVIIIKELITLSHTSIQEI